MSLDQWLEVGYKILCIAFVVINFILVLMALKKKKENNEVSNEELNSIVKDQITFAMNNIKEICSKQNITYSSKVANSTVKTILKEDEKETK